MRSLKLRSQRELRMRGAAGLAQSRAVANHLSAASGLVRRGERHFVVADDENHLAVFDAAGEGDWLRLFDGELGAPGARRKATKPDLETLLELPPMPGHAAGALLSLGSGSRPNRQRGVMLPFEAGPLGLGTPREIDLAPLYTPLRRRCADLNIEGGALCGNQFLLLQRANLGGAANLCIRYAWPELLAWLLDAGAAAPLPQSIEPFDLGQLDGVALGFTDATALPGGAWAFSAAAEATHDSYQDGACAGSVIGIVSGAGRLTQTQRLPGRWKVEGIAARLIADSTRIEFSLVTDADDRAQTAMLLSATLDTGPL